MDLADKVAVLVFIAGSFIGGMLVGGGCSADILRSEAIEAGVGRWVIDAKTGDKSFVYGAPKAIPAK